MTVTRNYEWLRTAPATLVWAEALDEGDTKAKVPFHDHLLTLSAPFKGQPTELLKLEQRFTGMTWGEKGIGLVRDFDRNRRWARTFMINAGQPEQAPKLIWERSNRDRYREPGTPVMRQLPNGQRVHQQK